MFYYRSVRCGLTYCHIFVFLVVVRCGLLLYASSPSMPACCYAIRPPGSSLVCLCNADAMLRHSPLLTELSHCPLFCDRRFTTTCRRHIYSCSSLSSLVVFSLLLSGDTKSNPGPHRRTSKYPCSVCSWHGQ